MLRLASICSEPTTSKSGRLTLGVADAVVRKANGTLSLIVDWKSDVDPAPGAIAHYRAQVETYVAACKAGGGIIVFLTTGRIERVGTPT
jgi:hypothetical protein